MTQAFAFELELPWKLSVRISLFGFVTIASWMVSSGVEADLSSVSGCCFCGRLVHSFAGKKREVGESCYNNVV